MYKQVEAGLRFEVEESMFVFVPTLTAMPNTPKENKIIRLVGEQAEAFDEQMDTDRDWFESSLDAFYFRPEIEGEFDEYLIAGEDVPFVQAMLETQQGDKAAPLGWVCVVDIGRYMESSVEPTGFRCRIRTSPPINGEIRKLILQGVCQHLEKQPFLKALAMMTVTKKQGVNLDRIISNKSKGKGFG